MQILRERQHPQDQLGHERSSKMKKGMVLQMGLTENKNPRTHSSYVALLCDIIDADLSSYEEVAEKKEWKEAMIKEY